MSCRRMLLLMLASVGLVSGCGANYHIARLQRVDLGDRRIADIKALAAYGRHPGATDALIAATRDEHTACRYFAAEALGRHLCCGDPAKANEIDSALVNLLDDDRAGAYTYWCYPLLPIGAQACTGSPRARALLTLTDTTGQDFGFDRAAWRAYFGQIEHEREGMGSPP